jgi:hypothetical protein
MLQALGSEYEEFVVVRFEGLPVNARLFVSRVEAGSRWERLVENQPSTKYTKFTTLLKSLRQRAFGAAGACSASCYGEPRDFRHDTVRKNGTDCPSTARLDEPSPSQGSMIFSIVRPAWSNIRV